MWTIDDTDSTWESDLAACHSCVACGERTRPEWLHDGKLCHRCVASVERALEQAAEEWAAEREAA